MIIFPQGFKKAYTYNVIHLKTRTILNLLEEVGIFNIKLVSVLASPDYERPDFLEELVI